MLTRYFAILCTRLWHSLRVVRALTLLLVPHVVFAGLQIFSLSVHIWVLNSPGLLLRKLVGSLEHKASWHQDGQLNIVVKVTKWAMIDLSLYDNFIQFAPGKCSSLYALLHCCVHNFDQAFKLAAPPRGMTGVEFPLYVMGLQESLQLLVASYLLQPLGTFDKHTTIIRVNDSWTSLSGYEAFETCQEYTTVSDKIVGTFLCVLLPSMLVYTIAD